jgi:hypothetical protein
MAPVAEKTLTRPAQVDGFLLKIVEQVVARTKNRRRDATREPGESVDGMVLLLARNSVARARPRLLEALTAKTSAPPPSPPPGARVRVRGTRRSH